MTGRLFRGRRDFRLYWSARAVSFLGDGIATVALTLAVQARHHSGPAVGALVFAAAVPHLLGPLAGTVADRLPGKPLMIACDLGQVAIYGSLAAHLPSLPVLLPLVALANLLATLFRPAGVIAVPQLVPGELLLRANAWLGLALNLQVALGPVAGGFAYSFFGVRGALSLDAATFACSALLLVGLRLPRGQREPRRFVSDVADGLRYVTSSGLTRALFATLFASVAFAAVDNVALVFLARGPLGTGGIGFSVLVTAFGLGMVAAAVMLTRAGRVSARAVYVGGMALNAIGTAATGLAPSVALAALAQAVAGAGNGSSNVGTETLAQRAVPAPLLGRAWGTIGSAPVLGNVVASLATGFLLAAISSRTAFLIGGAGTLAVAAVAARTVRER